MIDKRRLARLYRQAHGERWRVDAGAFQSTLEASVEKAFAGRTPGRRELDRYLNGLHLEDLALATACAAGDEEAWGHFVLEFRPALYRAADGIDPTGGARDLADSLYAELFGLGERRAERQPLFRYFHGRSSLSTWLRAVLTQRHIDRVRSRKRVEALPDDDSPAALAAQVRTPEPERDRFVLLMRQALTVALALLAPRDRLRLACYYAQGLTLAQTGSLIGEHEATVSRQLARTRLAIRESVEAQLRTEQRLSDDEVTECFHSVSNDAGPIDLDEILTDVPEVGPASKELGRHRSNEERVV